MRLPNGTVLPHGLITMDKESAVAGFNRTYKNFALKSGIVVKSYGIDNAANISKVVPEYDVVVIEQDGSRAITPLTYKNCIAMSGFGSPADFFQTRYRAQEKIDSKLSEGKDFAGQDGAIVLLLCLDGSSEKGVIIGSLPHPDAKAKLMADDKALAGEFNGIAVSIKDDGSANLTFKGETDNAGKPVDPEQGNTSLDIEKDGSFQLKSKGVLARLEKQGSVAITNDGTTTITSKKATSIKTEEALSTESTKDTSMKMDKFVLEAQGSASLKAQSFDITGQSKVDLKGQMVTVKADSMVKVEAAMITMEGTVFLGGAGGQPVVLPTTQFIGVGNLGAPVVSTAIGPFATKTFAV